MEPASPAPAAAPSSSPEQAPPAPAADKPAPATGEPARVSDGPALVSDEPASVTREPASVTREPARDAGGRVAGNSDGGEHVLDGDAEEAPDGPAPRLSAREVRRPRDMVLSLTVLLVPIALLLIFYRTVLSGDAPVTVDPSPTIQEAQQAKLFAVAVPAGLGTDWHVSSATFTRQDGGATLRLGYLDPDKDPIQLVESSVPSATLLPAELTTKAEPLAAFRAANGVWRRYDARPGEQALVLVDGNRTIIVVGKASAANLERFASALG